MYSFKVQVLRLRQLVRLSHYNLPVSGQHLILLMAKEW